MDLSTYVSIFNGLLGIIIFRLGWRYVSREMKTAESYTRFDRMKNLMAIAFYSLVFTLTILFIISLIISAISINAYTAFKDVENVEQINLDKIEAFQFPTFLPLTLIILTLFTFMYPFYEYLVYCREEKGSVMEIQEFIENKIIHRTHAPWSYIIAIITFFCVVFAVPLIVSKILINIDLASDFNANITDGWIIGLIFFSWLLLGPLIYLSYYSKLGTAHILHRWLLQKKTKAKRGIKQYFFVFIALISTLNTIYAFVRYAPILWGDYPDPFESSEGGIEDLIQQIVESNGGELPQWLNYIPIDFIFFILTTVFFALVGFYIKFLRKEPLNTKITVYFAAYIFMGTAYIIFLNTIIKWPWVFPSENLPSYGLNLDFNDSQQMEFLIRLFCIPILIEKSLNLWFLVKFLFLDKEIRENADEWILNNAIIEDDFKTITKYVNNKNKNTRLMSIHSVLSYVKLIDKFEVEKSKQLSEVLGKLIIDTDPDVREIVHNNISEIIKKLWLDNIVENLIILFNSEEKFENEQAFGILNEIAKQDPTRLHRAYIKLVNSNLKDESKRSVVQSINRESLANKGIITELFEEILENNIDDVIIITGILETISRTLDQFTDDVKINRLITLTQKIFEVYRDQKHHTNEEITHLISHAINTYASLVGIKKNAYLLERFLNEFKQIPDSISQDIEVIRQKIGSVAKFINIDVFASRFDLLFSYIENLLIPKGRKEIKKSTTILWNPVELKAVMDDTKGSVLIKDKNLERDAEIKSAIAMAIGSISIAIDKEIFEIQLFPHLIQLIKEEDKRIKDATVSSIILIAKTRPDISSHPAFILLLGKLLVDDRSSIRKKIYDYFIKNQAYDLINYITEYLSVDIKAQKKIELINLLYAVIEDNSDKLIEFNIPQFLSKLPLNETTNIAIDGIKLYKIFHKNIGVFGTKFDNTLKGKENAIALGAIDLQEAILVFFYELSIYKPHIYRNYEEYIITLDRERADLDTISDIQKLKYHMINFNNADIITDELVKSKMEILREFRLTRNPLIQLYYIRFYTEIYSKAQNFRKEIFIEILVFHDKKEKYDVSSLVMSLYIELLCKIFSDNPKEFFTPIEYTVPGVMTKRNIIPFEGILKRDILNNINTRSGHIQKAINDAFEIFYTLEDPGLVSISDEEKAFRGILGEETYQDKFRDILLDVLRNPIKEKSRIRSTLSFISLTGRPTLHETVDYVDKLEPGEVEEEIFVEDNFQPTEATLVKMEHDENINGQILAIQLLIKSPYQIHSNKVISILMDYVKTSNLELKENIANIIGHMLQHYEIFGANKWKRPYSFKQFRKLLTKIFFQLYNKNDPLVIKKTLLSHLKVILKKQPHIPLIATIIKEFTQDPEPSIALKAIKIYINDIQNNLDMKKELILDIQKFANNTSPEITSFIVQKSIELYTNGVNLKRLLPTFLKLASSPNEDVRNLIFNLFQRAYKKDPEEFIFFLDLIFKLTRDQNIKVRLDATNHLFKILFTTPQELLEKWSSKMDVYFKHFKNLAHDDNPDIRLIISNYLKELILVFPGRAKDILRILYIFIRSGENQVMESTSIAVKILLKNQPELKKKVSSDLKRFYTRSHDGMLLTLMNEVK